MKASYWCCCTQLAAVIPDGIRYLGDVIAAIIGVIRLDAAYIRLQLLWWHNGLVGV